MNKILQILVGIKKTFLFDKKQPPAQDGFFGLGHSTNRKKKTNKYPKNDSSLRVSSIRLFFMKFFHSPFFYETILKSEFAFFLRNTLYFFRTNLESLGKSDSLILLL